jgi:hypothetical protein
LAELGIKFISTTTVPEGRTMASKETMDPQYKFNEAQAIQRYKERIKSQKKRMISLSTNMDSSDINQEQGSQTRGALHYRDAMTTYADTAQITSSVPTSNIKK